MYGDAEFHEKGSKSYNIVLLPRDCDIHVHTLPYKCIWDVSSRLGVWPIAQHFMFKWSNAIVYLNLFN